MARRRALRRARRPLLLDAGLGVHPAELPAGLPPCTCLWLPWSIWEPGQGTALLFLPLVCGFVDVDVMHV